MRVYLELIFPSARAQLQETVMDVRNFFSAWIVGGGVGLIGLVALVVI